jgi:hypothetical protein
MFQRCIIEDFNVDMLKKKKKSKKLHNFMNKNIFEFSLLKHTTINGNQIVINNFDVRFFHIIDILNNKNF